jgi:hypothetical protein
MQGCDRQRPYRHLQLKRSRLRHSSRADNYVDAITAQRLFPNAGPPEKIFEA